MYELWVLVVIILMAIVVFVTLHSDPVSEGIDEAPPCIRREFSAKRPTLHKITLPNTTLYTVDDDIVPELVRRIEVMGRILPRGWPKNYTVYYFGSRQKKMFSVMDQGRDQVNGGLTFTDPPVTSYVYRREEAPRVLVHEILHAVPNPAHEVGCYGDLKIYEGAVDAAATALECELRGEALQHALDRSRQSVNTLLRLSGGASFREYMGKQHPSNVREYYLVRMLILDWMVRDGINVATLLGMPTADLRQKIIELIERAPDVRGVDSMPLSMSAVRV